MPVINCKAGPATDSEKGLYICPTYCTCQRRPYYVFPAQLRTKYPAAKWVLAGVAMILDIGFKILAPGALPPPPRMPSIGHRRARCARRALRSPDGRDAFPPPSGGTGPGAASGGPGSCMCPRAFRRARAARSRVRA